MMTQSKWECPGARYSAIFPIAVLLLLSLSLTILSAASHASEKLRVGWVYAMGNTPLLVAKYNGFLQQQGIDVELVEFDSGPLIKRALEADDLDLAYIGMPAMARAVADGTKLKIVAKVNYGNGALIVRKDSSIRKLADLKNRRIAGVRKGSGMDVLLRGFILKELAKLDPEQDVSILHMQTKMMDASVKHGVVDAAFTWEPFISLAVLTGHARVLLDTNEAIPNHPWYVIAARESTLSEKREDVYHLLRAHRRAVRYLRSDTSAGLSLIIDTFNLEQAVKYATNKVLAEEVVFEARKRLGWECQFRQRDRKFLQKMIDYSQDLGYIKKRMHADDLIDQQAIEFLSGLDQ
jgi:NitT/TauT family transport system substrate-binding protein